MNFESFYKKIKSKKHNKSIKKDSDNYWVLFALWQGNTIDDYHKRPTDNEGREVMNIKSRISDLKNKFGIDIASKVVDNKRYKEYWLKK